MYYKRFDGDGTPVLLLHGWGVDSRAVECLFELFASRGRSVISVDFFGFGESDPPPPGYDIFRYAGGVARLLCLLQIPKADVFGHSFGGRVGILLSATTECVRRLVLCGSAGLKPKRGIKYHARVAIYKLKKKLGLSTKQSGSADYRALSQEMRGVFVRVVNRHLDEFVPQISCPTLLLWGENDRETPPYMARKFEKRIPNSGLVWIQGAGHYAYIDGFSIAAAAILSFFKGEHLCL